MDMRTLLDTMILAENLKDNTRHSWTSKGRRESVAEHCFSLCIFAYFIKDEFPQADMDKVIRMCIFHDMGEAFTGDIPAFEKTKADEEEEGRQVYGWVDSLPSPYKEELRGLFEEMDAQKTLEAKLYKALDKMEVVIQHNRADIATWLPLEYEMNLVYGNQQAGFHEYTQALRKMIYDDSLEKLKRETHERE